MPARGFEGTPPFDGVPGPSEVTNAPTTTHTDVIPPAFGSMSEIVISGIAARLPQSETMEEFKTNLLDGFDMVTEDDSRWTPGMPSMFIDTYFIRQFAHHISLVVVISSSSASTGFF